MDFRNCEHLNDMLADESAYARFIDLLNYASSDVSFLLNEQFQFTAISQGTERLVNAPNCQAIGKCVEQMPYEGANLAAEFRVSEQRVLSGQSKSTFLSQQYCGKMSQFKTLYVVKKPIKNSRGKIVGVWANATDVSDLLYDRMQAYRACSAKFYPATAKQLVVDLDGQYQGIKLSPRQAEVMFFLLRCYSNKDIASRLGLSPRTVDTYVDQLRVKFSCSTRSQIIEHGLAAGFLGILPESLLTTALG